MICDGFTQKKLTEIDHGCQILVFLWAFRTDNCTTFIIFVLAIMDNKPVTVPTGEALGPKKSLQTHCIHIKLFLPSEDAFKSNKNCFTFKTKKTFSRVLRLKGYFYLRSHLILEEFNPSFLKVPLAVL